MALDDSQHDRPSSQLKPRLALEGGFEFQQSLKLFGFDAFAAKLYKYHGELPSDASLEGDSALVYEKAVFDNDISFSSLAPEFSGTVFDDFRLQNVVITYQVRLFQVAQRKPVAQNLLTL
jgi:hypothetical protein